ncbi:hypothetical protein EON66_10015 [archaeon]|nr:MAG: hypothetical protein EON66_10015 [archaeon]
MSRSNDRPLIFMTIVRRIDVNAARSHRKVGCCGCSIPLRAPAVMPSLNMCIGIALHCATLSMMRGTAALSVRCHDGKEKRYFTNTRIHTHALCRLRTLWTAR